MDLRELTKLALKLLGLYFLTIGLFQVAGLFAAPTIEWFFVAAIAWYLAIGAAFLWFPGAVINRVLRIEGQELAGAITASRLFGVGIALLGLYFTISALFSLVFTFAGSRWFYRFTDTFGGAKGPDIGPDQFASIVVATVQLIVGVALWFGWKRVVKLSGMDDDR